MSQLVRVLEKSVTLREFYYNKYVQELQATIESQKNIISGLRDTIAGQNTREEIMEREHDKQERKIEKLRNRAAKRAHHDPDYPDMYEVDFSLHEYARGKSDPESRDSDDKKYFNEGRCYDRGQLCGIPFCVVEWSTLDDDCMTCRAKICYGHLRGGKLVSGYTPTDVSFYQCSVCWNNQSAIRECACIVCDKLYNPHDDDDIMIRIDYPFILGGIKCFNYELHAWACEQHCDFTDVRDAMKAKNYMCTLCRDHRARLEDD